MDASLLALLAWFIVGYVFSFLVVKDIAGRVGLGSAVITIPILGILLGFIAPLSWLILMVINAVDKLNKRVPSVYDLLKKEQKQ